MKTTKTKTSVTTCAIIAFIAVFLILSTDGCAVTGVVQANEQARNTDISTRPFGRLVDGIYQGEATVAPPSGTIVAYRTVSVIVTVKDGSVASIKVDKPEGLSDIKGFSDLEGRVVSHGGLDVDCVSGATFSSIAFLKATEKAVLK